MKFIKVLVSVSVYSFMLISQSDILTMTDSKGPRSIQLGSLNLRSIQVRFEKVFTLVYGAIHTSELDRSEIDLSPKRSECERSNVN